MKPCLQKTHINESRKGKEERGNEGREQEKTNSGLVLDKLSSWFCQVTATPVVFVRLCCVTLRVIAVSSPACPSSIGIHRPCSSREAQFPEPPAQAPPSPCSFLSVLAFTEMSALRLHCLCSCPLSGFFYSSQLLPTFFESYENPQVRSRVMTHLITV